MYREYECFRSNDELIDYFLHTVIKNCKTDYNYFKAEITKINTLLLKGEDVTLRLESIYKVFLLTDDINYLLYEFNLFSTIKSLIDSIIKEAFAVKNICKLSKLDINKKVRDKYNNFPPISDSQNYYIRKYLNPCISYRSHLYYHQTKKNYLALKTFYDKIYDKIDTLSLISEELKSIKKENKRTWVNTDTKRNLVPLAKKIGELESYININKETSEIIKLHNKIHSSTTPGNKIMKSFIKDLDKLKFKTKNYFYDKPKKTSTENYKKLTNIVNMLFKLKTEFINCGIEQ